MSLANQIEAGRAYIAIRLDKAQLINGLADVGKRMRAFGASVQSFGSDMFRLSLIGAAPLAAATNSFIQFDDQMRITAAISGATEKQMKSLTAQARYLGSTTAFTAQQIGVGMTALARLGNSAEQIRKSIGEVMSLTRATGNEMWRLGEIAEITGNVMNQYGMSVERVGDVTNLLAFAANRSAQTVQDVGQAMRSVGGIANVLGESLEDTLASMMLLANRGLRGELGGTALRKAYDGIVSAEDKIAELGVSTRNAVGNLRKPYLIIADIFNTLSRKTNAEQVKIAKEIFGLRGMLAGMSIGVSAKEVSSIRTQLNRVHGYAKKTADQMESGIGGAWRKLMSMAQDVGLTIGKAVEKPITSLMQVATGLLSTLSKFITENKALIQSLVTLSAIGATAGAAIMALGLAIKVVAVPFNVLSGILAGLKISFIVLWNAAITPAYVVLKTIKGISKAFDYLMGSAKLTMAIFRALSGAIYLANGALKLTAITLKGFELLALGAFKSLTWLRHAFAAIPSIISSVVPVVKFTGQAFAMLPSLFVMFYHSLSGAVFGVNALSSAMARMGLLVMKVFSGASRIPSIVSSIANGVVSLANKMGSLAHSSVAFISSVAHGIRDILIKIADFERAAVAFVKSLNLAKIASAAYRNALVALRLAKIGLMQAFLAIKIPIANFIKNISFAKVISAAYRGTILLLTKTKVALHAAVVALKGAYISLRKAQLMAMAVAAKPFIIAVGAAALLGGAIYGLVKAYPKIRDAAFNAMSSVKGWWAENKEAVIDYGRTLYTAIQTGDMTGAIRLGLAGALKVFYSFAEKVVSLFADIRFNILDIWDSLMDGVENAFLKIGYSIRRIWYTYVRGLFDSSEEVSATINRYGNEEAVFNEQRRRERDSQRAQREAQRRRTQEFASGLSTRGDAGLAKAMNDAKNWQSMQGVVKGLNEAFENAASTYRDDILVGYGRGFSLSWYDRYTNIGRGSDNARNVVQQRARLQELVKQQRDVVDSITKMYNAELAKAQEDRVISDAERRTLASLTMQKGMAAYIGEEAAAKLQRLNETTGAVMDKKDAEQGKRTNVIPASFDARFFMFGLGLDSPENRTAKATESIDRNVRWLRDYISPIVGTVIA